MFLQEPFAPARQFVVFLCFVFNIVLFLFHPVAPITQLE